jgi:hypothetical protein
MKTISKRFAKILVLLFCVQILHAKILYVKSDGTGDGSSWANAANSIQAMIDKSVSGDEVWVAKGTYYPTAETIARDPRSKSFVTKSGVRFYGGFAGTETAVIQRTLFDTDSNGKVEPWEFVNKTILSGDIDGVADLWTKNMNTFFNEYFNKWNWTVTGNAGNCYRVVTANSTIDGFSVMGGNRSGSNYYESSGIYTSNSSTITNCTVTNCSNGWGGGIYAYNVSNCYVNNCDGGGLGGGIYAYNVTNCTVINCSSTGDGGGIISKGYVNKCYVSGCSASSYGGGIKAYYTSNCFVTNCSAGYNGGIDGLEVTNCTVTNCSSFGSAGGILASEYVTNCIAINCYSDISSGSGIYKANVAYKCIVSNCAATNNATRSGIVINSGVDGSVTQINCIEPISSDAFIKPTSFIGVATSEEEKQELALANWRLKEGSTCINAGTSTNVSNSIYSGNCFDNNSRVQYGTIDIGASEYTIPKILIPAVENFNNWTDFEKSNVFYQFNTLKPQNEIKWKIENQKALFSWKTNLTSSYSQPIFTYQIDASSSTKVFLRYDMYFEAYAGTILPLGTENLKVEYSTDLVSWSNIATYTNANGTIANKTYKHDISTLAAGKTFYIRFNANGVNSNRIEKWELDNVVIDADGISAVKNVQEEKYKYAVNNGVLSIGNLENGVAIQLYDTNGKLLNTIKSESNSVHLALPVKGVYLVKVSSGAGIENKKMVWQEK